MYYEYWGLKKPAFDNVPDPSMYVDCHASMENAIAETLFAIEEGDECVAVIVGDVGLGKTMSIRMIIDSLDQRKYKIVLITNPGISFVQILQEIIGQLTGKQCEENRKVDLLEIFNRQLFLTFAEGRKILIFIDEANAITPINLENLRLLTNMQGDRRNLFTMVLAGQIEFARRLEHPKRANLFQRIGAYNRIDKLESTEKVKTYVETRLMLAGATKRIFADDAFGVLWEQSDHGVPRLVNKLSKLCLKAGETNGFDSITGEVVEQIGSRFHKLAGPAIQKRRSRRRILEESAWKRADIGEDRQAIDVSCTESQGLDEPAVGEAMSLSQELVAGDQEVAEERAVIHAVSQETASDSEELIAGGQEIAEDGAAALAVSEEAVSVSQELIAWEQSVAEDGGATHPVNGEEASDSQKPIAWEQGVAEDEAAIHAVSEEAVSDSQELIAWKQEVPEEEAAIHAASGETAPVSQELIAWEQSVAEDGGATHPVNGEGVSLSQELIAGEQGVSKDEAAIHAVSEETVSVSQESLSCGWRDAEVRFPEPAAEDSVAVMAPEEAAREPEQDEADSEAEMSIGQFKITINLPRQLMVQSLSSSQEYRYKLAGGVAAETLKKHHHLIASQLVDPVPIWVEIRDFVLNRMAHESGRQPLS